MSALLSLLSPFLPYLAMAGAAIAALAGTWFKAHAAGAAKEIARQEQAQAAAIRTVNDSRRKVDAESDAQVKADLEKWSRQ